MASPDQPSLREWAQEGPLTLALSSGYLDFWSHAGVIDALDEQDIVFAKMCGSSAGGVDAVLRAAGVEPGKALEELSGLSARNFLDTSLRAGILSSRRLVELYDSILPVDRFEECGIEASVSTFDLYGRRTEVIGEGDIPTALHATTAVPLLVPPAMIDGRPKFDGGIKDWAGLAGADPGERILYHHRPPRESRFFTLIDPGDPSLSFPDLVKLEIDGMPTLTLSTLHLGAEAYRYAKAATLAALDRPIDGLNTA
jgi:NTE family protein